MKKIYHIAEDTTFESGGIRTVVVNLHNHLLPNFQSVIITNKKEHADQFELFEPGWPGMWNYSPGLKQYLSSQLSGADVFHLHGVFMHAHYLSAKLARKNSVPYVVTAHGMLEPWHLNDKRLKKKIYLQLFLNKIISKSDVLHAITPFEKDNLYKLSGHKNIVEIPNFINYSTLPDNLSYSPQEEYFLFLSRLHPKKGLDILIQAMSRIDDKKIKLKIVGTENAYSDTLKALAKSLSVDSRIEFTGAVYGSEKYNLFANAKAFIAPSYSEAIGMVNLEAAVCQTPVITTFITGISPLWNSNGGIMINTDVNELVGAINNASYWTHSERRERGQALRNFVIENYSWEKKGQMWDELYNDIKK